jgi:hypothetical protein
LHLSSQPCALLAMQKEIKHYHILRTDCTKHIKSHSKNKRFKYKFLNRRLKSKRLLYLKSLNRKSLSKILSNNKGCLVISSIITKTASNNGNSLSRLMAKIITSLKLLLLQITDTMNKQRLNMIKLWLLREPSNKDKEHSNLKLQDQ